VETNVEQPDEGSMESRVADALGLDEDEEEQLTDDLEDPSRDRAEEEPDTESKPKSKEDDQDETEESQPEFVDVEYGGKTYRLPPELKDSLMREQNYTQKTTELAGQRREFAVAQKAMQAQTSEVDFQRSVQGELIELQQVNALLQQYYNLDYAGMSTDEMVRTKHDQEQYERHRQSLLQAVDAKQREFAVTQRQAVEELLSEGTKILSSTVEGWSKERGRELRDFAVESLGFASEELTQLYDPRLVRVLDMAMRWHSFQTQDRPSAEQVIAEVPPVVAPDTGRRPMPESVKKDLKFRKEMKKAKQQGETAAANLIEKRLADKFG